MNSSLWSTPSDMIDAGLSPDPRAQKVLVQAVESLDLVDLPQSMVSESVSTFVVVALEDVVADLGELSWQECCMTSIEKISFFDGQSMFLAACSDQSLCVVNHSLS
ncbi:hypothetical protein D0Y65_000716 [Glycine soja]|uniref:Uncharacterized protein n=1 Tax=Glycine soja TaxID=3848 RepID=A0A445LZW0_GLYSO|nr:hypothetical protein D0Y65_000716 [Glycine soja]